MVNSSKIPNYMVENTAVFPFLAQAFAHHKKLFQVDCVSYIVMSCSPDITVPASGRRTLISVELQSSLCALIHPSIYILHKIYHRQGNINANHLPPSLSQINRRGTLNMAPRRRATERRDQLVASVDRGHSHPSSVPGWVGGIWWPRQGPLWCDTHTHTRPQKSWSHPGWAHDHCGRHGVTKPLTEEGFCVRWCVCDPTLEAPKPPLLRTLATACYHIPVVTLLLSLLIKIRAIYLRVHVQHMRALRANRWQAFLSPAGPLQRLNRQQITHSLSLLSSQGKERKCKEEDRMKGKRKENAES